MFTGIVEEVGKLSRLKSSGELRYITIDCRNIQDGLILGASICCNGICLTVNNFDDKSITVAAMPETIKKTNAASWHVGTLINLERALTLQSRLDGHLVQGHVDTVAKVKRLDLRNNTAYLNILLPREFSHLVVKQGSIAVDGVSLTASSLEESFFTVSLVEYTLQHTSLKTLKAGDKVNLEFDIIGKYIMRKIDAKEKSLSEKKLHEMGY